MGFHMRARSAFTASAAAVWVFAGLLGCDAIPSAPPTELSAEIFLDHVKFLAGDELAGRRPGTVGNDRAADYIAKHFAAAGLEPVGDDGTYFQHFEVMIDKRLDPTNASLTVEGLATDWQVTQDWIPMPFSASESASGPLAFGGYGVEAIDYGYNDYAGFDAQGKILLIFRYEPADPDPAAPFGGADPSPYATFMAKADAAKRAGAKALLIVNPQRAGIEEGLYPFDPALTQFTHAVPLIHVTRPLAETLLAQAGLADLDTLQQSLDRDRVPLSTDMGLQVELHPGLEPNLAATRNVVGLLRGNASTTDTIVVGAHYDHVGYVPLQFERTDDTPYIHNGADDNASGTAGMLELVRVLAQEGTLRRNVLFVAFSAEEIGLLGSAYFVDQPTLPLPQLRTMVNFDMIGRFVPGAYTVYGVHSAPEFPAMIAQAAASAGLECRTPAGIPLDSDHANFNAAAIPVLYATTGLHDQYHTPADDWPLINAEAAVDILTMFRRIITELANLSAGPTFTPDTAAPE